MGTSLRVGAHAPAQSSAAPRRVPVSPLARASARDPTQRASEAEVRDPEVGCARCGRARRADPRANPDLSAAALARAGRSWEALGGAFERVIPLFGLIISAVLPPIGSHRPRCAPAACEASPRASVRGRSAAPCVSTVEITPSRASEEAIDLRHAEAGPSTDAPARSARGAGLAVGELWREARCSCAGRLEPARAETPVSRHGATPRGGEFRRGSPPTLGGGWRAVVNLLVNTSTGVECGRLVGAGEPQEQDEREAREEEESEVHETGHPVSRSV